MEVLGATGSTNAVLADRARAGAVEGLVVVTEHQTSGRGRLGRVLGDPGPRRTDLLGPGPPASGARGALAVAAAADRGRGGRRPGCGRRDRRCSLKWPNDVLPDGLKLGGMLVERVETPDGPAAVLGIGLNVSTLRSELPVPTATSLVLAGMVAPDRTLLLLHVLDALASAYARRGSTGRRPPRAACARTTPRAAATLGSRVRVELPSGGALEGTATAVAVGGGLVVSTTGGEVTVSAGDVVHVRPVPRRRSWDDPAVSISPKLLNEGEHVVVTTRTHVKVLIGAVLILLVTVFVAAFLAALVNDRVANDALRTALGVVVGVVAAVVVVVCVVRPFLRWYTTTYTFTEPALHPAHRLHRQGGPDDPAQPDQRRRLRDRGGRPALRLRHAGGLRRQRAGPGAAARHPPGRGGPADRRRGAAPAHRGGRDRASDDGT